MNRKRPLSLVTAALFVVVCAGVSPLAMILAPGTAWAFENDECQVCHGDPDMWSLDDPAEARLLVHSASFAISIHADFACVDCHAGIEDLPHDEELPKVDCAACHDDVTEVYAQSVHGIALSADPEDGAAACTSCHGVHDMLPASDPRSTVHHQNLARTCSQCHQDEAFLERHREMPSGEKIQTYAFSVHGQSNEDDPESTAATCNNCHGTHDIRASEDADSSISRANVARTCGACHSDVLDVYYGSVHGHLAQEGNPDVPVCTDCHGEHSIRSLDDRESTVSRFRIAETCGRCHEDASIVAKYEIPIAHPTAYYKESVHGKALLVDQNEKAAACQDCHGYHSILGGDHPESTVNRKNTPATCGQCHAEIEVEYEKSIHGKVMRRGVREAPVCTDCHGEHRILSHLDPDSPVYPVRLAKEVCGHCHDSLVLNRKYGLPEQQVTTYFESYHGLASRLGDTTVANCASCHGVHNILPQSDPESMVHPDNLLHTCGSCHPGISPAFVAGLVHVTPSRDRENLVFVWVRRVYIFLIIATIGGMLVHNLIIMFRHIRDKYRRQKKTPYVVRFPRSLLIQHLLLTVAFILLVITGFSLKFPDSLFSQTVATYMGLGEKSRALVHRIAGVLMVITAAYHAIYTLFTRRGREELRSIMIRPSDFRDAFHNLAYHLGLARTRPAFDRFDYSEKFEYWALIWGTLIMVLTGFMLWFPAALSNWGVSRFWIDVARVVHYYEAWLATLAILVWHFFFVLFHPEEYPMALSWITGKLPIEAMEERHPRELERLLREGRVLGLEYGAEPDSEAPGLSGESDAASGPEPPGPEPR